jgi:hypothetical protein
VILIGGRFLPIEFGLETFDEVIDDRTSADTADNIVDEVTEIGSEGRIGAATIGTVVVDAASIVILEEGAW